MARRPLVAFTGFLPLETDGQRDSLTGSEETPGVTGKFGLGVQNEARQWLTEFCTGHSKHPLPTTQEKTLHMDITRWSILKSE